jgi:microcystin-dependent protein
VLCDGSAVSRTGATYSALFTVIGTLHGSGDGTTTYNLPDYRGRFLRGTDEAAGRDPDATSRVAANNGGATGDSVGSVQDTATKLPNTAFTTDTQGAHTHTPTGSNDGNVGVWNFGIMSGSGANLGGANQQFINLTLSTAGAHAHTVNAGGDKESRPVNAGVNYIIKL